MFQEHQRPPFSRLAAHWSRGGATETALIEDTRSALAQVQPSDLLEVRGLVQTLLGRLDSAESRPPARRMLFTLLDAVRRRAFSLRLPGDVDDWIRMLLTVIERSDYTFGEMLRSREETDPRTVALRVLGSDGCDVTVADLGRRTRAIARGLLELLGDDPGGPVAILSENRLESALCDLACLSSGIVDFPLPANATAEQVVYMLRHSGARVLLASEEEQAAKVLPALGRLPDLRDVVTFSRSTAERHGLLSLDQMVSQASGAFDDAARQARAPAVRSSDLATVMYTSGTTGRPKGIVFTHLNVVSKRLCRGFALPEVGEGDVFLCYLPLYHTFGRWLELAGTLWWGATYVFARSTGQASLAEDFANVRPTVFISVPKKWFELYETAARDAEDPGDAALPARALTGGRLRWGLSAAGYLDPAVFRTLHRAGVELCSGYGMTEATGGVTMTPPGGYVEGSIGKPLPGIECLRADDGELLIRGPYVSPGYFKPEEGEVGLDSEGWFHTGDLVSIDGRGHYRIAGRKKEIYKNRMGQTIAPQRIENLFRDFDAVSQAFLVGDHREYNTLLVWPNYDGQPELRRKSPEELRELLSSLVASANRFLAPFERVVSFSVLPRALDEENGEVTKKGTFKREVVEQNWKDLVDKMYEHKHLALPVDGFYLRIPNWVLREMGVLQHEVTLRLGQLVAGGRSLVVGVDRDTPGSLRLGDLAYSTDGAVVDLGAVLASPSLWLGNAGLSSFLGEEAFSSLVARRRKASKDLRLDRALWLAPPPGRLPSLLALAEGEKVTLDSIHAAGELLRADRSQARRAVAHLQLGLTGGLAEHAALCRALLRRGADSPDEDVRRRAFQALLPGEEPQRTLKTLRLFLDRAGLPLLSDEELAFLEARALSDGQMQELLDALSTDRALGPPEDGSERRLLVGAMRLLTACASTQPSWYARVRVPLARLALHDDEEISARAAEELDRLRRDFSAWIGPNLRLAIDWETGTEYGWKDAVAFEPAIDERARALLMRAFVDTTLVRASVFLFGRGALISLADLPRGGASVTHLGTQHGKSVYRLSLHTRAGETFDVALNLVETMHPAELREEISWLLAAGAPPPLLEAFGGYFPEYGIFTEEFIPGEDVARQMARYQRDGQPRRLRFHWPFLAWNALACHVGFWDRTGRRLALREPSPVAFIVPSHDYQVGTRLVSISQRSPCGSFDELLDRFLASFVDPCEAAHPELRQEFTPEMMLCAPIEALGLERGWDALEQARSGKRGALVTAFQQSIRERGYTPLRLHFAARRYERWTEVNPAATVEARGKMLGELWGTYRLAEVEQSWPDTRVRFFRRTVFAHPRFEVGQELDRLMARARALPPGSLDLGEQVASFRGSVATNAEEDYFLARMTYRYLSPTDDAALISMPSGDRQVAEVVLGLTDEEGDRFWVRGPVNPREVARLLQIYQEASLAVTFASEHEFLLALDSRGAVLGGVYYRWAAPDRVQMEKMVIARRHRGKGLAEGLMRELVRRLRGRGAKAIDTGFYQPDYMRRFGFRTEPTSGGLVLDLGVEPQFRW